MHGLRLLLVTVVAAILSSPSPAAPPQRPSDADIDRAISQIEGIYADKSKAARTPAARSELAREIFGKRDSTEAAAERYALATTAFNLASRGDDAALLISIADSLKASFGMDMTAALAERLGGITGPVSAASWATTAGRMNALIDEALDRGEFAVAGDLVTSLASLAKRARDPKMVATAAALRKTIVDRKKADDRFASLREAASRPGADDADIVEFGRALCFGRNDWATGLDYLSRSRDPDLSGLAKAEREATDSASKIAVADRWAAFADRAAAGDRVAVREHAIAIYQAELPSLTGLAKVKVDEAVDRLLQANSAGGKDPNAWLVLFRSDKPDAWNTKSTDDPKNFAVSLDAVPSNVKFVRMRRANGSTVILGVDRQGLGGEVTGQLFGWNGTKEAFSGATLLGITDRRTDVDKKTGSVALSRKGGFFSGWGFGHRIHHGGAAEVCWNSEWIPRETLEISVISRPLTPDEQRFLLR